MDSQPESSTEEKVVSQPTAITPAPSAPATPVGKPVAGKGVAKRLWLLTLLLAVVAVAGSAGLFLMTVKQEQLLQDLKTDTAAALQRLDAQSSEVRGFQRELDRQQDQASHQQQQLKNKILALQEQLTRQNKRLLALSTTDRSDWLLAEVEYLMRLANQRLLMGREIHGAIDLLKAANNIAQELDDSALFSVRKSLAEDIAALKAASKTDLEGIYLQLAAATQQVDTLRLIQPQQSVQATLQLKRPVGWQQQMEFGVQSALQKLAQYIKIQRRDEIYQPLLAPESEAAVRQNIQLMLEQAQMASLAGKQRLYDDSLAKAKSWLEKYYALNEQATQAIISTIDELALQQVAVVVPDISGSLRALKTYIETVHQVTAKNKTKEPLGESAQ